MTLCGRQNIVLSSLFMIRPCPAHTVSIAQQLVTGTTHTIVTSSLMAMLGSVLTWSPEGLYLAARIMMSDDGMVLAALGHAVVSEHQSTVTALHDDHTVTARAILDADADTANLAEGEVN